MTIFNRAMTSLKRRLGSTLSLLFLLAGVVIIFFTLFLGRNAVSIFESDVIARFPAISVLTFDDSTLYEMTVRQVGNQTIYEQPTVDYESFERPSFDFFEKLSSIDSVIAANFSQPTSLYGRGLHIETNYFDIEKIPDVLLRDGFQEVNWFQFIVNQPNFGDELVRLNISGFSDLDVRIESGMMEIVSGESFTDDHLKAANNVVLISDHFARKNNLSVGSIIELENITFNIVEAIIFSEENFDIHGSIPFFEDEFLFRQRIEIFEVIGIYSAGFTFPYERLNDETLNEREMVYLISEYIALNNALIVPITVADRIITEKEYDFAAYVLEDSLEESTPVRDGARQIAFNLERETIRSEINATATFLLDSPHSLLVFKNQASEVIPEGWHFVDASDMESHVLASLNEMLGYINYFGLFSMIAAILVAVLVFMLYMKNRKKEIAVYLALGMKKVELFIQFLVEFLIIAIMALGIGIGIAGVTIGPILSQFITLILTENPATNLEQTVNQAGWGYYSVSLSHEISLLTPTPLTVEEMLEFANISVGIVSVLGVIVILLGIIGFTLTGLIISINKKSVKEILSDA